MSRKKRKPFPKEQLLYLFKNQNFQKVVSKIKQFAIEDISEDELLKIHLDSLVNLSIEHFKEGDVQRALRDIQMAIDIQVLPEMELLKLKYLCYLEKFEDAFNYSKSLLDANSSKIKKDVVFYHLLANIYANHTIDEKYLKNVTKTKKNYILGLLAFFNDDKHLCFKYLDQCKPRLKVEKQNLEALKSIISNEEFLELDIQKPLYRFLILGDSRSLQNTKETRGIKPTVEKFFKQKTSTAQLDDLIKLKHPVDTVVLKQQNDIKLVFNNIALLVEIENNHGKALDLFMAHKNKLVNIPESIYLLISIHDRHPDALDGNQKTVQYIKKYLQLHSDKLPPFAMGYIFYSIFINMTNLHNKSVNNQYIQLAKQYDQLQIQYMIEIFPNAGFKKELKDKYLVEHFFKKFSIAHSKSLKYIITATASYEMISDFLTDNEKIEIANNIGDMASILNQIESVDIKYKNSILDLLDAMSSTLLHFSIGFHPNEYKDLNTCVEKYSALFGFESNALPQSMKNIFAKVATNSDHIDGNSEDVFDLDDDLNVTIGEIFGEFKLALKSNEDPFEALEDFPKFYHWFFEAEFESVAFDLMSEYARFETLTRKVIEKIFKLTRFDVNSEIIRKRVLVILNKYAQHSPDISLEALEYLIELKKSYEAAWYMHWLYAYIDISYQNSQQESEICKKIVSRFIEIQKKKKFTTLHKKYERVLKLCKLEDVDYNGSYKQQSFDF